MAHPRDAAMEEIWAIELQCWREVQGLPEGEAVRARLRAADGAV